MGLLSKLKEVQYGGVIGRIQDKKHQDLMGRGSEIASWTEKRARDLGASRGSPGKPELDTRRDLDATAAELLATFDPPVELLRGLSSFFMVPSGLPSQPNSRAGWDIALRAAEIRGVLELPPTRWDSYP